MTKKERYTEALIHLEEAKSLLINDEISFGARQLSKDLERLQMNLCSMLAIENLPKVEDEDQ